MADKNGQKGQDLHGTRIAALMTCHNRVACTTASVRALKAQIVPGASLDLFLVDDESSDGTAQAVINIFPQANILTGDGNLFWCGGMRLAFEQAIKKNYDFYFWLNDDTNLDQDALARMLDAYRGASAGLCDAVIIVGSTRDPETGVFSYGGWSQFKKKSGLISWKKMPPNMDTAISCDTINGNCALISKTVVARIGNIDAAFQQGMGDLDYGLRAIKNGCQIQIAPGYYGTCPINDHSGLWMDGHVPLYARWQKLLGPKGLPVKAWGVFTYRHKGHLWFLSWLAPYILFWFKAFSSPSKDRHYWQTLPPIRLRFMYFPMRPGMKRQAGR
jgi:GT2 family glycosyltransferase